MIKRSHSAAAVLAGLFLILPLPSRAAESPPKLEVRDIAAYRQHLHQLQELVRTCSMQRSPGACDPAQVGADEEVVTTGGVRLVHYGWLRQTLMHAVRSAALPATQSDAAGAQLPAAAARLAQDDQFSSGSGSTPETPSARVRTNLSSILAEHRFQRIQQEPNVLQRAYAAILKWLFERFSKVAAYGGRNPWIARLLEYAAILVPCVLLTWWVLVRLRKQAAAPRAPQGVAPAAPSAREWQLWLQDADRFAGESRWREAIHHIYWAAISRLESHGLWPADRTRTPREYLELLRTGHSLEPDLRRLTRSFELIWYGNRPAAEEQYRDARARMERLVPR